MKEMESMYVVLELGAFEFWGSLAECRAYVATNDFKDSYFTIVKAYS